MRPSSLKQKIMSSKMDEGEICYSVKARHTKIERYHGYKAGRYMLPNDEVTLSFPTFQTHQFALTNKSYKNEMDREDMKHHISMLITEGRLQLVCDNVATAPPLLGCVEEQKVSSFPDIIHIRLPCYPLGTYRQPSSACSRHRNGNRYLLRVHLKIISLTCHRYLGH
jgi:hypothetical protein